MKIADIDDPVLSTWFIDQGLRLDPRPYISETYAARMFLKRVRQTDALADVAEGIFTAGRFRRHWTTDRAHGVPFLSSTDIFQSDLSSLAMITKSSYADNPKLPLRPGWTLITCSGMTSGRVTYARYDMDGYACSQDALRVVPAIGKIPAGYLYAFLASPFGTPLIKGRVYGTSVKHLEASHLADLPIPRLGSEIEEQIDFLFWEAMDLRAQFQVGITSATRDLFDSAGLPELTHYAWHDHPRDLDFYVEGLRAVSLRALNYSPRASWIMHKIRSATCRTLGDICKGGYLDSGIRFKRIDRDAENGGVQLINQRQGFWARPEGRWIDPGQAPKGIFAQDGTVMVASQGTLGENEVFGRALLVTGAWLKKAYSQHFLRVLSGDPEVDGAYLFAFLRSEAAFRVLRSMSAGGKQQDIHNDLRSQIPVPMCTLADRKRIAATVRQAHRWRDLADELEDKALALLDTALREAAR